MEHVRKDLAAAEFDGSRSAREIDPIDVIDERYRFYQDGWRLMFAAIPVLVLCIVAMTIFAGLAILREPQPNYFATQNGYLVPAVPLSNPYKSPGDLNQWVARAVTESYMLDFQHYITRIEGNAQYFTREGHADYKKTLETSGRLKLIKEGWFVVSAVPTDPPLVVAEGVTASDRRYFWRIRMPVTVSYSSKTHSMPSQKLVLTIVVVRVDTRENPYGVGISQIIETAS